MTIRTKSVRTSVAIGVATALMGTALPLAAATPEGRGFYVAADAGLSNFDASQDEFDEVILGVFEDYGFDVVTGGSDFDDSDMGYSISLGYSFNRNWAVEAAWMDLGAISYTASLSFANPANPFGVLVSAKVKSTGPAVTLVASLPLSYAWALDARVGAYFAKTEILVNLEDGTDSASDTFSDEDTGVILGVGATWTFRPQWALRAGYSHISDGLGTTDVDQLTVGVKYTF